MPEPLVQTLPQPTKSFRAWFLSSTKYGVFITHYQYDSDYANNLFKSMVSISVFSAFGLPTGLMILVVSRSRRPRVLVYDICMQSHNTNDAPPFDLSTVLEVPNHEP